MMNKEKDVWRDEGYEEEFEFLKNLEIRTVTLEYVSVKYEHDENYSTAFQMRHVIDPNGNRGFMCFVSKRLLHVDTFHQGMTQEIYDEVKRVGEIMQQEELRRSWLNLNRR